MTDCLVIGGVSPIGRALDRALTARGLNVTATSRRAKRDARTRYLDLESREGLADLPDARLVAIVAAETKFTTCDAEPERTVRINRDAPVAIAAWALERDARVLFFSSIAVFDGMTDLPQEGDPPTPNSVYGRQKAEAEAALSQLGGDVAMLRPGKVIDGDFALYRGWLETLEAGAAIEPFEDMLVAPVFIDTLADAAARLLADSNGTGVFHLSAADNLSYAEIGAHIAARIGADPGLVRPVPARDRLDPKTLWLPVSARLDCRRMTAATRIAPPDPRAAIDAFLAHQRPGVQG